MDDWQLLKDYAMNNSEEAFRALVDRYAGMVYHAALRQTRDPHAAEDVAQVVFIALARKAASIPRQATLYGWLFRAVRFAVLNQARQNAHRELRELRALVMQTTTEPNDADSLWERITPHLNDALEKLSAADRELVMIRFFGDKSTKEAAETLGVSEETARKRLSRAIERLRVIFAKRGIAVSSLALAAAFAARASQAAPVEAASSWANVAMAKAAAGSATSAGGILALATAAKSPVFLAALAGLMILSGAVLAILRLVSHRPLVAQSTATNLIATSVAPDPNSSSPGPVAQSKVSGNADTNAISPAALDKVRAALHDPTPTDVYPNAVMQEAIAGLGDKKKAAVQILEAALKDADAQVRLRAVDGLGIVGPEAKESATLLLEVLRGGGFSDDIPQTKYKIAALGVTDLGVYTDNIVLYALGEIHPKPEILPDFARLLKESQPVCRIVYQATKQVPGVRRNFQGGGWLWAMAGEDSKALNKALRPLLQDSNQLVRIVAAVSLVSALGTQADPGVFAVAAEMLRSDDDTFVRPQGIAILNWAATEPGADGRPGQTVLNAPRFGPYLNETVLALADAAHHSKREDLRLKASKMLDVLVPDFRKSNPAAAAELEQQDQTDALIAKVVSGEADTPEILEGLKRFPKAAPRIAAFLARNGSNGVELLPAFGEALAALAPSPEASKGDQRNAVRERALLADAMQKIAPELPKTIFTDQDTFAITKIMRDAAAQDDTRSQKVAAAREQAQWPDFREVGMFDVSPNEIRRLLATMKDADTPTHDALVAKVKVIDPHFFDTAAAHPR